MDAKKETKTEQIERLEKDLTWHEQERIKCFAEKEKLRRMLDEGVKGLEQTYNLLIQMITIQHGTGDDVNGFRLEIDYLKPEVLEKYTFESETAYNGDGQPEAVTIKVMPREEKKRRTIDELHFYGQPRAGHQKEQPADSIQQAAEALLCDPVKKLS